MTANATGSEEIVLGPITNLSPPPLTVADAKDKPNRVRRNLAVGLLVLLALVVILGFVLVFWPPAALAASDPNLESRALYVQGMLGVVASLFGAAAGFYFASGRDET